MKLAFGCAASATAIVQGRQNVNGRRRYRHIAPEQGINGSGMTVSAMLHGQCNFPWTKLPPGRHRQPLDGHEL